MNYYLLKCTFEKLGHIFKIICNTANRCEDSVVNYLLKCGNYPFTSYLLLDKKHKQRERIFGNFVLLQATSLAFTDATAEK